MGWVRIYSSAVFPLVAWATSNGNLYFSMRKEIPSRSMDSSSTTKILYITHLLRLKIMKKYFILFSSIQYV